MIARRQFPHVKALLRQAPAIALLGPRQSGKTSLALEVAAKTKSTYLDLESPADRAKLEDAEAYLEPLEDQLVILDEVQRAPELFQTLRGLIDRGRRRGTKSGRFLLLGPASLELLLQSGESLAGRIAHIELTPFDIVEAGAAKQDALWIRGGFPESFLAGSEKQSLHWRNDFVRTYLERDIPQLGPRIPSETLRRFWTMLAHHQGGVLNAAELARSLAVDGKTIAKYLDLMVDLLLVRRLAPLHRNVSKRLVKSPKVYVRDSGLVHALLGLETRDAVLGRLVSGGSWEGFVVETLINVAPDGTTASFYRTSAGAEIDLVLELPGGDLWAIEVKRGLVPKVERGFYNACEDLAPKRRYVVYSGSERYALGNKIEAISLFDLATFLAKQ